MPGGPRSLNTLRPTGITPPRFSLFQNNFSGDKQAHACFFIGFLLHFTACLLDIARPFIGAVYSRRSGPNRATFAANSRQSPGRKGLLRCWRAEALFEELIIADASIEIRIWFRPD